MKVLLRKSTIEVDLLFIITVLNTKPTQLFLPSRRGLKVHDLRAAPLLSGYFVDSLNTSCPVCSKLMTLQRMCLDIPDIYLFSCGVWQDFWDTVVSHAPCVYKFAPIKWNSAEFIEPQWMLPFLPCPSSMNFTVHIWKFFSMKDITASLFFSFNSFQSERFLCSIKVQKYSIIFIQIHTGQTPHLSLSCSLDDFIYLALRPQHYCSDILFTSKSIILPVYIPYL